MKTSRLVAVLSFAGAGAVVAALIFFNRKSLIEKTVDETKEDLKDLSADIKDKTDSAVSEAKAAARKVKSTAVNEKDKLKESIRKSGPVDSGENPGPAVFNFHHESGDSEKE